MKNLKFILFLLFLLLTSQNIWAQNSVTIVAVGEAQSENDKLAFTKLDLEGSLTAAEKAIIDQIFNIFISDFSFYKHLFDVETKPILRPPTNIMSKYETWAKQDFRYVIENKIIKKDKEILLASILHDVQQSKVMLTYQSRVPMSQIRNFAHDITDKLYRAITGKRSIFKTKIVFVSDRTSSTKNIRKEIYIMDFDGQRKQRLTYTNSMVISPAISPDNQRILYSVIENKWKKSSKGKMMSIKNINIYEMNLLTKRKRKISQLDGINSGAIYTHEGNSIYLTLSNLRNADIYKMNLQTGRKQRVTTHFSDDVDPHINANGDLMTFLSGRSGKAMIYTMDPRSVEKDVKRISYVGRFNAAPRFSPDGKEIVFSSWVDNRFDLYKIDSNGNNLVRLTKNFGSNEEPWFSPDGQFIIFTSQRVLSRNKAVQNIYIMNKEGEILKNLTNKYGKCYTPRWSN